MKDKSPFSNVNFGNKFQGNQNEIEPLESIPIVTREWIEHKLNQSLDSLYFPLKSTFKENENENESENERENENEQENNSTSNEQEPKLLSLMKEKDTKDLFLPLLRFHYCNSFLFLGYDHIRFSTEKSFLLQETLPSFEVPKYKSVAAETMVVLGYEAKSIPSMFLRNMFTYMLVRDTGLSEKENFSFFICFSFVDLLFDFFAGFIHEEAIKRYTHYGGVFRCLPRDFTWNVEVPSYFNHKQVFFFFLSLLKTSLSIGLLGNV